MGSHVVGGDVSTELMTVAIPACPVLTSALQADPLLFDRLALKHGQQEVHFTPEVVPALAVKLPRCNGATALAFESGGIVISNVRSKGHAEEAYRMFRYRYIYPVEEAKRSISGLVTADGAASSDSLMGGLGSGSSGAGAGDGSSSAAEAAAASLMRNDADADDDEDEDVGEAAGDSDDYADDFAAEAAETSRVVGGKTNGVPRNGGASTAAAAGGGERRASKRARRSRHLADHDSGEGLDDDDADDDGGAGGGGGE